MIEEGEYQPLHFHESVYKYECAFCKKDKDDGDFWYEENLAPIQIDNKVRKAILCPDCQPRK